MICQGDKREFFEAPCEAKRTKDWSGLHSDLSSVVSHAADVLRLSGAAPISVGHRPGD